MQPGHVSTLAFYAWTMAFTSAPAALHAAAWESIPASSGIIVIESDSLAFSNPLVGAGGVWVRYTPTLAIDCSPPRGCYANSQRIYYNFSCVPRYAVVVERISMDLNGAVLKRERAGNYAATNDEAAKRILKEFCRAWERD
jgi:hypothetical protein